MVDWCRIYDKWLNKKKLYLLKCWKRRERDYNEWMMGYLTRWMFLTMCSTMLFDHIASLVFAATVVPDDDENDYDDDADTHADDNGVNINTFCCIHFMLQKNVISFIFMTKKWTSNV